MTESSEISVLDQSMTMVIIPPPQAALTSIKIQPSVDILQCSDTTSVRTIVSPSLYVLQVFPVTSTAEYQWFHCHWTTNYLMQVLYTQEEHNPVNISSMSIGQTQALPGEWL